MKSDTKNFVLAIALSLLVIVGWNYFYGVPQIDKAKQTTAQLQGPAVPPQAGVAPTTPGAAAPGTPAAPGAGPIVTAATRAEAIAESPRVKIDTPSVYGSIALKGGRIDDLSLKAYRETSDPKSPQIILLSPAGSPATNQPYYFDAGFVSASGATTPPLPNAETLWTADSEELTPEKPLTLTWDDGQGFIFHRIIAVDDQYMFTVKDTVENHTAAPVSLSAFARVVRVGTPKTSGYSVLFEGMLGFSDSLVEESYSGLEKETRATHILNGTGGWLGFTDKYWATVIIPDQTAPLTGYFSSAGDTEKTYQAASQGDVQTVAAGGTASITNRVFSGAKVSQIVDNYQAALGIRSFDLMIDWGHFYFITKPLFHLIDFIYKLVGNFGLAIMIVTVLVKICFFPLANRSYRSMAKMKALQPHMAALKERYPDDKKKQQSEMMELYKREKVNPIAGCLPVVLQIPVFFALYKVIFVTIEMRQAPFFGWITDLSSPDPTNFFTAFGLLHWDPTQLPVFGHFLSLGILPVAMGISMFVQMKMNPTPADPVQKQMFTWMPVIWAFMMGSFPAGLLIYWTWSNIFSICQQAFIMRQAGVKIELWDNLLELFGKKKTGTVVGSRP